MGISKAKGMALANRLAGTPRRIFVLTGDGELQEGQFWESLAAGRERPVLARSPSSSTTTRSSRTPGSTASATSATSRPSSRAFGWHVDRCDGHDLAGHRGGARALARAATDRPRLIIADTVKGGACRSWRPARVGGDGLYRFHSGAPSVEHYEAGVAELVDRVDAHPGGCWASALVLDEVPFPARVVPAATPAAGQRLRGRARQPGPVDTPRSWRSTPT